MNKCCLGLNIAKDAIRNGNGNENGNARQPKQQFPQKQTVFIFKTIAKNRET